MRPTQQGRPGQVRGLGALVTRRARRPGAGLVVGGAALVLGAAVAAASCRTLDRTGLGLAVDAGAGGFGSDCSEAEQCPGLFGDCARPDCLNGYCATWQAPVGAECDEDGGQICTGHGDCVECTGDEHCAGDERCQQSFCVPAHCLDQELNGDESDLDCGGSCAPCANDRSCRAGPDCVSGFCADGTCAPCSITADCSLDEWCDPTTDEFTCPEGGCCVAKKEGGDLCAAAEQCQSGFCPEEEGACCNEECAGLCHSCIPGNTGLGLGECGPTLAGLDPQGECPDEGPASCLSNGEGCSGSGSCIVYPSGTVCVAASCAAGVRQRPDTCDGNGHCDDQGIQSCSPYQCNGTDCATSCSTDAQCLSGAYCAAPSCVSKGGQGDPCGASNQCSSTYCVDGYCCENACPSSNDCMACSQSRTGFANGLCRSIPTTPIPNDPDNECTDGACYRVSDTDGQCRRNQGIGCTQDTQCLTTYCRDGYCCESSCTGTCKACRSDWTGFLNGQCRSIPTYQDPQPECANGACYRIDDTTGECRLDNGQPCTSASQCLNDTHCVDGRCCENACTGECRACRADWTVGANGVCSYIDANTDPQTPSGECTYECNGQGACEFGDGTGCSQSYQCDSTYCVDDYCCEGPCSSLCEACRSDWTYYPNGQCAFIKLDTDPEWECPGGQLCNGVGACYSPR